MRQMFNQRFLKLMSEGHKFILCSHLSSHLLSLSEEDKMFRHKRKLLLEAFGIDSQQLFLRGKGQRMPEKALTA